MPATTARRTKNATKTCISKKNRLILEELLSDERRVEKHLTPPGFEPLTWIQTHRQLEKHLATPGFAPSLPAS